MADLSIKYMGITLRNPLIVASSGLTDTYGKIAEHDKNGAGAVVLKSLFEEQIMLEAEQMLQAAKKNNLIYADYSETLDYIDVHLKEKELGNYLEMIRKIKKDLLIPVIASVNCLTPLEWTGFAREIEHAGANALELNIFIMPFNFEGNSTEIEEKYYTIVKKVKSEISIPVAVKISPFFANLGQVIARLESAGANAVVLFNRFARPDINIEDMKVTNAEVYSTPEEISNTLRWIAIMANRVQIDLVASTGVHDGAAMIKQILAGADAVQVASALYKNGSKYIPEMLNVADRWMTRKGFNYIDQFKGMLSQEKTSNPDVFERLQFMKYFSDIK